MFRITGIRTLTAIRPAKMLFIRGMDLGFSILVVDDESLIRRVLSRIVQREGHSVTEAEDGVDALEKMEAATFDIVITDVRMPRLDGYGLLEQIKAQYPKTSVIIVTAYGGQAPKGNPCRAKADCYIAKPFKNLEIAQAIALTQAGKPRTS